MNTKIKTEIAVGIILLIAIVIGGILWLGNNKENQLNGNNNTSLIPYEAPPPCANKYRTCPDGKTLVPYGGRNCDVVICPGENNNSQIANPASAFCKENGGVNWEIRTGLNGGQSGYCIFSDGSECEEWAYYNGQCKPKNAQAQKIKIDLSKIEFDACGKKEKYQNMTWWNNFKNKAEQVNFYSENYIKHQMNSGEKKYGEDYSSYCQENQYMDVCAEGRNYKLSFDENIGNELEGCLSKDGNLFIAVFKGVYMGGGNHIFRYDTKNDILEEAVKINETWDQLWFAVPKEILKREESVIKMIGKEGDAGVGVENAFDYNFVENTVKLVKSCSIGEGSTKSDCKIY